jgi:hypothetical protein
MWGGEGERMKSIRTTRIPLHFSYIMPFKISLAYLLKLNGLIDDCMFLRNEN